MTKKSKQPQNKKDRLWAEAKHRCCLNADDVRMAKEMGLNPRSLIKNIPSKTETACETLDSRDIPFLLERKCFGSKISQKCVEAACEAWATVALLRLTALVVRGTVTNACRI